MEGVWIGGTLLSLDVGPLEIKGIRGIVQGQMLGACRGAVHCGRERTALSLTDVMLYYRSTCSRAVSLSGIPSLCNQVSDHSQIEPQHLEPCLAYSERSGSNWWVNK